MKKRMKLVCMVLTLAMLLGLLAGCGGKGGDDSNGGGSDQTLLLGLIVMVLYKPRTWCAFCPMGTMTQSICKLKNKD